MVGGGLMNLEAVLSELAARLSAIDPGDTGLRVYDYMPDAVTPPAAIVYLPDAIVWDATYGRGSDDMTVPVVVVLGRHPSRAARENLVVYCNGTGAKSVKAAIEAGPYTSMDTARVVRTDFDVVRIGGQDYAGALNEVEISGSGA